MSMRIKRLGIWFMTLALLSMPLAGGALAQDAEGTAQAANAFSDVSRGHWAEQAVSKLASLGVINGRGNGIFAPSAPVSHQDAIIMIIGFMGLKKVAEQSDVGAIVLPRMFLTQDYSQIYINQAIRSGLLYIDEELNTFVEEGTSWGKSNASREWVAKMIIRAIEKESAMADLNDALGSYPDANEISAWAVPYLNAVVSWNIMSGSDGKLMPGDDVTRAQMAVLLEKADKVADLVTRSFDTVKTGQVDSINVAALSITTNSGEKVQYALTAGTQIFNTSGAIIPSSSIEPYYSVYVVGDSGSAYYVEVLDTVQLQSTEVVFMAVDGNQLTVKENDEFKVYTLDGSVVVSDLSGNGSSVEQLVRNSIIELYYSPGVSGGSVQRINIKQVPLNKTADGTFQSLADGQITVVETATGQTEVHPVSDSLAIHYENRQLAAEDLHQGDLITYTVESDVVTDIVLTKPLVPLMQTDAGMVSSIKLDTMNKSVLTLRMPDNKLKSYYVLDNVVIVLDGADSPSIADIHEDDDVDLEINNADQITKITVVNRQITKLTQKKLISTEKTDKQILLWVEVNANENPKPFIIDNNTEMSFMGTKVTVDSFDSFFKKDQYVDLIFSNDQLISFSVAGSYEGVITGLDPVNSSLQLNTSNYGVLTFKWSNFSTVENFSSYDIGFGFLTTGMPVAVTLAGTQQSIDRVKIKQTVNYQIVSTSAVSNQAKVRDHAGATKDLHLGSQQLIKMMNKANGNFTALHAGDTVFAVYEGMTLKELHVTELIQGKVSAIQDSGKTLTVIDHTEKIHTVKLASASQLAIGDRVAISQDGYGNQLIHAVQSVDKTFASYNSSTGVLTVKIVKLTDQKEFQVASDVKVQDAAGNALSLLNLPANSQITLFMMDGIVVEILKK